MTVRVFVLTSFLASRVEMVEALTIVLAIGINWGWRSLLLGVGAAGPLPLAVILLLGVGLWPSMWRSGSV